MLAEHHVASAWEIGLFFGNLSVATFDAMFAWIAYLAIEPAIRIQVDRKEQLLPRTCRRSISKSKCPAKDFLSGAQLETVMYPRLEFATLDGIVAKGDKTVAVAIKALKVTIGELMGPKNAIGVFIKLIA